MSADLNCTLARDVHLERDGAMVCLVRRFQDPLFGYASRLLPDSADAEEVVQDVFIRAHRALVTQYDEERCRTLKLRPWLFRIARNQCYNRLRSRRGREEPLPECDGWHEPSLRYLSRSETDLEAEEAQASLEQGLRGLNKTSREVIVLRFIEDLSHAEIAEVMNTSEAAVRGKVFRALAQMRAQMVERGVPDAV